MTHHQRQSHAVRDEMSGALAQGAGVNRRRRAREPAAHSGVCPFIDHVQEVDHDGS